MRLSRVPVLSLDRHGLVYDLGGLLLCSPIDAQQDSAFQRVETVRGSRRMDQASVCRLSRTGPQLNNNFRGSIQTLPTRSTRLLTFVSAGQRVSLPGWLAKPLPTEGLSPPG